MNYIKTIRLVKSVPVVGGDHQNDYLYIFQCSVKLVRPLLMFVSLFYLRFNILPHSRKGHIGGEPKIQKLKVIWNYKCGSVSTFTTRQPD